MKFGVCGGPELSLSARIAGFDYFEWTVGAYLKPLESEEEFLSTLKKVESAALPCPILNVFVPGSIKITGPDAELDVLKKYVDTVFFRAEKAGIKIIVFGSGGARNVPEGFPRNKAWKQLIDFGHILGDAHDRYGVLIAVEHLNTKESNILTSLEESANYVREVNRSGVRLLVDAYHFELEKEAHEVIVNNGDILIHAHIATPANRLPPGAEVFDFGPFIGALNKAKYNAAVSIEARITNPEKELSAAYQIIQSGAG